MTYFDTRYGLRGKIVHQGSRLPGQLLYIRELFTTPNGRAKDAGVAPEEVAKLELHLAELWRSYRRAPPVGVLRRSKSFRTLSVNCDIYR